MTLVLELLALLATAVILATVVGVLFWWLWQTLFAGDPE